RHRQVDDGNRGGVGGQDRLGIGVDLVEGLQDAGLQVAVLCHGLDHELTVGQVLEVVGVTQAGACAVPCHLGDLAAAQSAVEGGLDASAACLGCFQGRLGDQDVDAAAAERGDF